jgi:hypothetical protein
VDGDAVEDGGSGTNIGKRDEFHVAIVPDAAEAGRGPTRGMWPLSTVSSQTMS